MAPPPVTKGGGVGWPSFRHLVAEARATRTVLGRFPDNLLYKPYI